MGHRKLKADHLFNGERLLNNEHVLIIKENGEIINIVEAKDAGEEIETFKGILSPGFINAHCHLELSHMKNVIAKKTGLINFVFGVVSSRHFSEEEILDKIKKGEEEMLQAGIIAVGDICNNSLTVSQKIKRNLHYYNFIETSGWLPEIASLRFEKAKNIFDDFQKNGLESSIVPHAPYSVSENLWNELIPFFPGKTVSIHNQESAAEDLFFLEGKGDFTKMFELMKIDNSFFTTRKIRSVETYFQQLSLAKSIILVHNTFTRQEDLDFINECKKEKQLVSFCLCPNANLYIENTLPPVELFIKNGCHIVLGTDSLASNHQLNILEEIKTIVKNFPKIGTETLLKWATQNGAKSLQMEEKLGSFEKGKKPGIILIENVEDGKITGESKVRNLA